MRLETGATLPNTTASTTLDIKVNARQLTALERLTKRVFSNRTPREFNTAVGQINRSLEENVRTIGKTVEAMGKVERGGKAWKKMATDIRDATKEANLLTRALAQVERSAQRIGKVGSGGGAGTGGGGGGRMGGMPGISAPMPGMGAITTALGAIPVAGAVAAGSLMAAAQTYQSRMRFENARMEAAPYLMGNRALNYGGPDTAFRAAGPQSGDIAGAFVKEAGTARRARAGVSGLTEVELGASARKTERENAERKMGRFGSLMADIGQSGIGTGLGEVLGLGNLSRRKEEKRLLESGPRASIAEAIGTPAEAEAARIARQKDDPFAALSQKRISGGAEAAEGRTVVTGNRAVDAQDYRRRAIAMGIAPAQAMQMAGEMSKAAGRPVSAAGFEAGLAIQRTTGIGVGQTGAAMQALRRSGGKGSPQEVANLIGTAVTKGLVGSEIGEYLQQQTAFLQQQSNKGITVELASMRGMELGLGRSVEDGGPGIAAFRTQQIVSQFGGGGSEIGFRGPKTATDLRLMEAMGFTGQGGIEEYSKFRLSMQDPGKVAEALPAYLEAFQQEGAGPEFQALITQQALNAIGGTRIGPDEARRLAEQGVTAADAGTYDLNAVIESAQRVVSSTAPSAIAEASIESGRVNTGAAVAKTMQDLARTTTNMAGLFNNTFGPAVEMVTTRTQEWTAALEAATDTMWDITPDAPIQP